ncbi:MAG TPA: Hpt domain-containing protein [Pyrinomonadaceae bacterium]|nr:Hpt domain-containing protein [Pyrinomonadaceae bacterium]
MTDEQRLFLDDANEIVERLYSDLKQLRVARLQGKRRRQLAAQIFRRVHTLKGSAASFGFDAVSEVAHQFEAVLDKMRLGRLNLTAEVLDVFEDAVSSIDRALQAPNDKLVQQQDQIVKQLARYATSTKPQGIATGLRTALPPDIASSLSEYDLQHAREAIREGAKLFIVSAVFSIDTFDRNFRELTRLLGQSGEVIATTPGGSAQDNEINFRILYATDFISGEVVRQASLLSRVEHHEIRIELPPDAWGAADETAEMSAPAAEEIDRPAIRVALPMLDDLITTASELFRQAGNTLTQTAASPSGINERAFNDLRVRFVAFEERLIRLRLIPAREVLERAALRAGRIAARHLGKEVEFRIEGADVGIERSLAEIISDPLLHLVRNAIIHGLETPDERRALGKDPVGRVTLTAANRSGRIHINVSDDGRGIDLDRIMAAAAEQGISETTLSEDQCLRLIFRPGFSTSQEVSELAGRGIGLDVVDRAMDIAGGEVRVATEKDKGTTFAIIVPAALSLVNCVIVRCEKQLYAIDSNTVEDGRIQRRTLTPNNETADVQDLPLVHLGDLINQEKSTGDPSAFLIWRRAPAKRSGMPGYRIGVDEIIATRETLVRGLGRHAYRWVGICGGAEMLDGTVALVLDLPELIESALELKN